MTQDGIARAAWIHVPHVIQYVRPLVAADLVRVRTAHVRGGGRKRKVYELTDAGKLKAYGLRESIKGQTVRVRDGPDARESTVDEVLKATHGALSLLDVARDFALTGAVDLVTRPIGGGGPTVRFLADAPRVDDFVGRKAELDSITGTPDAPRIFVVRGVAGIGKSTLGAKACELLGATHHVFWHRVRPWDTPQSLFARLASFLAALGKPSLKNALAGGGPAAAASILREDLAGLHTFLVVDDAHEASKDLIAFLRFLVEAVAAARDTRLLVLTRRSPQFYDVREAVLNDVLREMDLGRLDPEAAATLVGSENRGRVPRSLGGHPLFLRLLRSSPPGGEKAQAIRDMDRFFQQSIYAELSEPERRVMKVACLYQLGVSTESLLPDPGLSRGDVLSLMDRALLLPVGEGVEVHDSVRGFFANLLTAEEATQFGRFAGQQLFLLAKRAQADGNLARAIDCLSNALKVAPDGPGIDAVAETLGDLQEQIGDLGGGVESYRRASAAAPHTTSRARLQRKLASMLILRGLLPEASENIDEGFRALAPSENGERGWLHLARCRLAIRREDLEEALEDGKMALHLFQAAGDPLGEGQTLYQLAHVELGRQQGSVSEARRYLERAIALSDSIRDPGFLVTVHSELAYLFAYRLGALEQAEEHLASAAALLDPAEISYRRANFLMLTGVIDKANRGDFDRAKQSFQKAVWMAGKLGSLATLSYARFELAHCAFYQGGFDEALSESDALSKSFEQLGSLPSALDAELFAAECCLLKGEVETFVARMKALAKEAPRAALEARAVHMKSLDALRVFLEGRRDSASELSAELIGRSRDSRPEETWHPHFVYALVLRAMGNTAEAKKHRDAALSILRACSLQAELDFFARRERYVLAAMQARPRVASNPR